MGARARSRRRTRPEHKDPYDRAARKEPSNAADAAASAQLLKLKRSPRKRDLLVEQLDDKGASPSAGSCRTASPRALVRPRGPDTLRFGEACEIRTRLTASQQIHRNLQAANGEAAGKRFPSAKAYARLSACASHQNARAMRLNSWTQRQVLRARDLPNSEVRLTSAVRAARVRRAQHKRTKEGRANRRAATFCCQTVLPKQSVFTKHALISSVVQIGEEERTGCQPGVLGKFMTAIASNIRFSTPQSRAAARRSAL
jgi:hypothetical protein